MSKNGAQSAQKKWSGVIEPEGEPPERAIVAGTGLLVFEIYNLYRAVDRDWDRMRGGFHWLSKRQLRAALDYAFAHEDAMEARLAEELRVGERLEAFWKKYPDTAPPRRA